MNIKRHHLLGKDIDHLVTYRTSNLSWTLTIRNGTTQQLVFQVTEYTTSIPILPKLIPDCIAIIRKLDGI